MVSAESLSLKARLGCQLLETLGCWSEDALVARCDTEYKDVLQAIASKADSRFHAVMRRSGLGNILGAYGQQEPRPAREGEHLKDV